ncbi:MAG: ParB/RepB/Spo0J family partition protein [Chloroflexota bacterium]|nr:MAG: ParB/RepB/Spo0J family partition protein [Chloroflexota bacterium]
MNRPKGGLGRGLGALIPHSEQINPSSALREISIDLIEANPHQPRQVIDPAALEELADSIRQHGLIHPLIVAEIPQQERSSQAAYYLIAGERRWQATRLLQWKTIPVLIKEATPQQMLELALVENLQRSDLNPLESAAAYQQLSDEFGLTHEEISRRVGKNRVTVTNTMRLLRLPDPVKNSLAANVISEGHARALLALTEDDLIVHAAEEVQKKGLSVRQTEELVRRWQRSPEAASRKKTSETDPETAALEGQLREALGTRVVLQRGTRGGKVVIFYYSDEELQGLYDRLAGS